MGKKKKKPEGVWSDRRKWLMQALWALFILVLGKGWDWFQTGQRITIRRDTPITPATRSLSLGGGAYRMVLPPDALTLTERLSYEVIRKEPRDNV